MPDTVQVDDGGSCSTRFNRWRAVAGTAPGTPMTRLKWSDSGSTRARDKRRAVSIIPASNTSISGLMPRSTMARAKTSTSGRGFRNTSLPKLQLPVVSDAISGRARPEMASLTTGSCNFGNEVFLNPLPEVEVFARAMVERGIKPEIEVFEAGMIETALRLSRAGVLPESLHFNLVMGVPGAVPATARHLLNLVEQLPPSSTWTVSGIGRGQLVMAAMGLVMGGHVRTGLEDNIYF